MISFIIPAYNEEFLIGRTIDALHTAAMAVDTDYEVIVVDDASSDRTDEVALAHEAQLIRVNNRQISATRNAGALSAKGEYFIFVDADTVISHDVLRETLSLLEKGVIGGGAAFKFDGKVPVYARALEWFVYRLYRWCKVASGSYLFCTRDSFEKTGGFDERLYASEEAEMSRALKRCGEFVVLKERVLTSGRKLRFHSFWEIAGIILRVGISGGKIADRKTAHIWYEAKRESTEKGLKHRNYRKYRM